MEAMKKFVVIGPESTGKSTLCSQLAQRFNTKWVPEYAREYLEKNGTNYTYDDLLIIAKGQIDLEESLNSQLTISDSQLFIDTDMYVMKVWCEYVFNKCHNWILNRIVERKYDGYLLCNVDLPWVKDNLREYPDLETRNKLYHFYRDILINQNTPWVEINGSYQERFEGAVKFVTQ
jgi:NadR type nicotinamide-nucleotide adenylyltransferase